MMITSVNFLVKNLAVSQAFYTQVLGFEVLKQDVDSAELTLGGQCANIVLVEATSSVKARCPEPSAYWKIGITVHHLDLAFTGLKSAGIPCSSPSQFLDIGYLLHLQDPDGNTIELLQTTFKGEMTDKVSPKKSLIKQPAVLAHISLRTSFIEKSIAFYQEKLGMLLQASMDAKPYNFSLYFLGYNTQLPTSLIDSVERRKWLWAQTQTFIELQHYWHDDSSFNSYHAPKEHEIGFTSIVVSQVSEKRMIDPSGIQVEA
jgi:catechol 2,3-dioxygenase-like lactoylglutathione lyase family enzyme